MKSNIFKVTAAALILALCSSVVTHAGPIRTFDYDGAAKSPEVQKVEEKPGIKYTPVALTGLPVKEIVTRKNANTPPVYTYEGSKKIILDFKTPGVSLSISSNTKDLEARIRENYIHIENKALAIGESAKLTLTAAHKDFDPVVQEFEVTLTDGSVTRPHIISSKEDLLAINSELGINKFYRQTADISLKDVKEWAAIGTLSFPFTGSYNGGGFKITDMEFSVIDSDIPAFFGHVKGKSARVFGLNLEGKIDMLRYPTNMHGTVVGILDEGTISDCSFTGSITFGTGNITTGGIVAQVKNGGVVSGCSFDGKISTKNTGTVGGIVGLLNGTVDSCVFNGEIISESSAETNMGGIVGINKGAISKSYTSGDLSRYGQRGFTGGIAGFNYSDITDSAYNGRLYAKGNTSRTGGIAGGNGGGITGCAVKGAIIFDGLESYIGGISGQNEGGHVSNSVCEASIEGKNSFGFIGGITGENYSFVNSLNSNSYLCDAAVSKSSFRGSIKVDGETNYIGGIAGRNYGFTMIEGGKRGNASSIIEKCASFANAIDGWRAGRISGDNRLEGVAGTAAVATVHIVALTDNAALDAALVNGKKPEKPAANSTNGADASEKELIAFETANSIKPDALEFFKEK